MIPMRDYGTLYSTGPLGWLNEDTVISRIGTDVVAWTYETGELQRLTQTIDSPLGTGSGGFSTIALALRPCNELPEPTSSREQRLNR